MPSLRTLLCAGVLVAVTPLRGWAAQKHENPTRVPIVRVKSSLVILDVTVLDKKGRPVVKGLTQDDFTILQDKKPQRIFSFEPPDAHVMGANPQEQNPEGQAPVTIFVLDRLNCSVQDFVYVRGMVHRYLMNQPKQLRSPAELMVLGNRSLEMVQGYTRSREDLLFAVKHLPTVLPFKYELAGSGWRWERAMQSYDALEQVALQNQGVPGRKNIVWVGYGGPSIWTSDLDANTAVKLKRLVRDTVNTLVTARVSLFVIYPGLETNPDTAMEKTTVNDILNDLPARNWQDILTIRHKMQANKTLLDQDPFASDVSFAQFASETGGSLFYNRNDVDVEIKAAQTMGAEYYTLAYQPPPGHEDGKFRHVRVVLRNPKLRAVTKDGYYAPDKNAPPDPQFELYSMIYEAAHARVAYRALEVKVIGVLRHPDVRAADFTVELKARNIRWRAAEGGTSAAEVILAGASLSGAGIFWL